MRRQSSPLLVLLALLALAAHADPTLVSVTPTAGPTIGGTTLTITMVSGTFACGIDPCTGAQLLIGGVPVTYTTPSSTTIVAVTPAHAPGAVNIELRPGIGQIGTASVLQNAFVFEGNDVPALSWPALALLLIALVLVGGFVTLRS